MAGCTHHIYKSVNSVYYCCICGARIDPPKPQEPPQQATNESADGKKQRRTRKKGV